MNIENNTKTNTNALKVLVVGFSVTEMPSSFVPVAQKLSQNRQLNLEIRKCGIGGITPESLVYFIDNILQANDDCSTVIFEIATSYVRQVYAQHMHYRESYVYEIWKQIERLVLTARSRGKSVGFLNLPRTDVNYGDDLLESIISKVADIYSAPVLSVSNEFFSKEIDIGTLLLDEVHPSPLGAEYYAEKLLSLIPMTAFDSFSPLELRDFRYGKIDLSKHTKNNIKLFQRHGFEANYIRLQAGSPLTLKFEKEQVLEGFAVIVGPKSGNLRIETDQSRQFMCYDEHCYYERIMTSVQPLGTCKQVTFELSAEDPGIPLKKGEKFSGTREIGLIYLFTQ